MNEFEIDNRLDNSIRELDSYKNKFSNDLMQLEDCLKEMNNTHMDEGEDIQSLIKEIKEQIIKSNNMNLILEEYINALKEL